MDMLVKMSMCLLEGDGPEHWVKPVSNTIKINVDESEEKSYGYAYVVLDENGFCLEAAVKYVPRIVTPPWAEAIGIKEALSWVKLQQGSKSGN